jgi:hypothetical protein
MSIRGVPIKSNANNGLYQKVPNHTRWTLIAYGMCKTAKSARAAPINKAPTNDRRIISTGFFMLLIPLPSKLPTTDSTNIAARSRRKPVIPAPVLPEMEVILGKLTAPARDSRNNKTITRSAFTASDPKFMVPPVALKCRPT